ncbi:MAG: sulfite exporter TauE/SafE family protein [Candidatus Hadarchaeales archaeon]
MIEVLLFPAGLSVSLLCSSIGLGGGIFMVPLLLWLGLPTQVAIGTSLFAITVVACSSTLAYALQRRIDYRTGLLLDSLDVPGAVVGAYLTTLLAGKTLSRLFGSMLLGVACHLWLRKKTGRKVPPPITPSLLVMTMVGSFTSGLVSGMFGIGGGIVDEIVMLLALGMSIKLSAGTAMFGMSLTTLPAFLSHFFLDHFSPPHGLPLAAGCAVGGPMGAMVSKKLNTRTLQRLLGVVVLVVGIRLILWGR